MKCLLHLHKIGQKEMTPTRNILTLILFLFAGTGFTYSQVTSYTVRHFTIEDGLSQNTVNTLFVDNEGFLWAGTQDGLNKYDGYTIEQIRSNERGVIISSNFVRSIMQTFDNELLILTPDGVNKLNSRTGSLVTNQALKKHQENTHKTSALFAYQDKAGIIWFATENGLDKYNPKTKETEFYREPFGNLANRSADNRFTIIEDNNNQLWMGSKTGLVSFNKISLQYKRFLPFPLENVIQNEVSCVLKDDRNILWVGTQGGLFQFVNQKDKGFKKIELSKKQSKHKSVGGINVVFKDHNKDIWVGTRKGLFRFNKQTSTLDFISMFDVGNHDLSTKSVLSIAQDNSNILWIGTGHGLIKLNPKRLNFKLHRQSLSKSKLTDNKIYSIFVKDDSTLWIGTRGFGLSITNQKSKTIKYYTYNNKNNHFPDKDNELTAINRDKNGRIWIGTKNGVFIFEETKNKFTNFIDYFKIKDTPPVFKNNRVMAIIQTKKEGNYWFATKNGLYFFNRTTKQIKSYRYDVNKKNTIASNQITDVLEDYTGLIWITSEQGLNCFCPETKEFTLYTGSSNTNINGLSNSSCLTLFESSDSTLWVGTETGLNKYNRKEDNFKYYTKQHGFKNGFIYCIEEDKNKDLWVSTNNGVARFRQKKNSKKVEIQNFSTSDGLQDYEFNIGASFNDTTKGIIYFGGVKGFNSFNPDSIYLNEIVPKVKITQFYRTSNETNQRVFFEENDTIRLSPKQNSFKIEFRSLEFTMPKNNKYKFQLYGESIEEIPTKSLIARSANSASYSILPSGTYTFKVIGSNNDQYWNTNEARIVIIIETPFYRTVWAYLLCIFVCLVVIFLIVSSSRKATKSEKKRNYQVNQKNKELEEKQKALEESLQETKDSITYANRIITAMMPSEAYFKKVLPASFVYFKPKSVVSGDFYWIEERGNLITVAAVDCTGHGVPGAFMSIVGMNLLRTILDDTPNNPAEVLNQMNRSVTKIFEQKTQQELTLQDGMDMSLCTINTKTKTLQYAGAKNPLYLMREKSLIVLKADRFAIGPDDDHKSQHFKNHTFQLEEDDFIYMFSDGFADQFGGTRGKKFKFRKFRHMLLMLHEKAAYLQKEKINETFHNWVKGYEQVDDILIIGIRPLAGKG